ncbi:alpha/beta hydrolase [Subtercola boreus]|uniref:Alpha/beta hydrolase fold-3 domain-containing protein n=1 Tax=Subtercola boreus TaxID=120213 RepID=A0A3E0WD59_9MICO|nr:alpha/beta hydrolase fold domain-containing protein [Subtercola boreus]RFA20633.1 hypothetical protein B7R24_09395 [Subtercola boreus]RFA20747.1 hypothetical protein B7R23_09330 [Subtercola boreus]RFA26958.1 hypothetical protein B7R25_09460 [Subtercola boreus]
MSADAAQATEPGRGSTAAWVIEHVPVARGFYAGKRAAGVAVQEQTLSAPLGSVRLRLFSRAADSVSLVVVFPDEKSIAARGRKSGEWLASSLAKRLPLTACLVHIPTTMVDDREAAYEALMQAIAETGATKVAVLGVGTGGALAARTAMKARDVGTPPLARNVLIAPDFQLIAGPPATDEALHTSLVARLSELPATLLQQYGERTASRLDPSQDLTERCANRESPCAP